MTDVRPWKAKRDRAQHELERVPPVAKGTPKKKKKHDEGPEAQTAPAAKLEWRRDARGRIIGGDLTNLRRALAHVGVTLGYNDFAKELRVDGAAFDDIDFEKLWTRLVDTCGWHPSRVNLRTVIIHDAHAAAMHPVRDYLAGLTWDGTPRLDAWLITYAGAPDTAYVRAVSPLPLLAAVRRVRVPGTKFDELLVLESPQGWGKSSALRALCGDDWFSDDLPLGVDAKVIIERTAGKWIIEAAELHGHRGRETDTLKAFLSRQVDGPVRLAYGRFSTSVPRQFVIIGTTNHGAHYLKDSTGARRFWPVTLQRFDVAAVARDRDQVWAEAVAREPETDIRLASDLWADAAVEQEARRAVDPWEDVIASLMGTEGTITVSRIAASEIWNALRLEANQQDNRHADRVAVIMERHGYRKYKSNGRMFWELQNEGL